MLELRALGNAEIETDTSTLTPSQEIVFAAALYLVLERERKVSRSGLAELLWPTVDPSVRAHRFRQTLLQLKKLGFPVVADRDSVRVSTQKVHMDIDRFLNAESQEFQHRGSFEFLPGYSPRFSEPFRDWVDTTRSALHSDFARSLLPKIESARAGGQWPLVDHFTRVCLSLDPYNEVAVLAKAEATAMCGGKREAVQILDKFIEELGGIGHDLVLPASLLRKRISAKREPINPLPPPDPDFMGREAEMHLLTEAITRARGGKGGGCLVCGEPGIGKSRLAREISEFAAMQGVQVQRVACRRSDVDRPMSALVDLVPGLRDLPGALGCSPETLTALKRLTEFDGRGSEGLFPVEDLTSVYGTMRRALFDLLDALVEEQCLLIVVDDVHWLDQASTSLLADMIRWASHKKLLFVFCSRTRLGRSSVSNVAFEVLTLELPPLSHDTSLRLLQATLSAQPRQADDETVRWLLTAADGNPLFLQELTKRWLETGHKQEIPPSLATVLDDRLSRLSPEAINVLQACAVLGERSTVDKIEAVLEYKPHELLSAFQELSIAGMLARNFSSADFPRRVQVKHDLLSLAAVAKLAPISLAFIHGRAGRITEREISGERSPTSILWACAFHWSSAGDFPRALAVVSSCADHLLEVGLPAEAIRALDRALEYCLTDADRLAAYSRLAVALQMNGQWEQSKEMLTKCRRLTEKMSPDIEPHDEVEIRLFDARWKASLETETLLSDLLRCVESPGNSGAHRAACALLSLKIGTDLGETGSMRKIFSLVEPLLETDVVLPVMKCELRMVFHSIWGEVDVAMQSMEDFLTLVRAEKNSLTFSRALANAGVACRLAGRNTDSAALYVEAVEYSVSHGLLHRAAAARFGLVRLHLATGNVPEARRVMTDIERSASGGDDIHSTTEWIYIGARLALEEGNLIEATALYEKIQAGLSSTHTVSRRGAAFALGVRIGLKSGVPVRALQDTVRELHAAHLVSRSTGLQDFEAVSLFLGLQALGMPRKATALLRDYAERYRREKWPVTQEIAEYLGAHFRNPDCHESNRGNLDPFTAVSPQAQLA